ncbi:aminopeptidase P family protein [Frisingicoccus sp.]|uniref:aminopeptidase P family protein n=1 Tax=Frisingicoccus sp. TaxID=1918627 RepID=UPI00399C121F
MWKRGKTVTVFDERIETLREAMRAEHIDFYLIPTADDHASEYVSDYYKVRNYYAGFTGSAGTLLIGMDMAGLWTDGRYFIQAENQLAGSKIRLFRMGNADEPALFEYLRENLPTGGTLAFDGQVVNLAQGQAYADMLASKQGRVLWDHDLAGSLWRERPSRSSEPVYILDEKYTGKSRRQKLEQLRQYMKKKGGDAVLLASLEDIAWLMNLRGNDVRHTPVFLAFAKIDRDKVSLYADSSAFSEEITAALAKDGIVLKPYMDVYDELKILSGENLMYDPVKVNYALSQCVPEGVQVLPSDINEMIPKSVKNETELDNLRRVHIKDGVAVTRFMYWLKKNVGKMPISEISASDYLEKLRSDIDTYLDLSFDTISAYKANAAMMHYSAAPETDTALEPSGMLLVDSGGQYYEGTTDITRTFILGPISEEEKKHFTLVAKSMLNLANARFLYGCSGYNLDILARGPLWNLGIDYQCGTGHGVGYLLSVHEGPNGFRWKQVPERKDFSILEAGMVTTDEPGVYIEGSHGIRTENELICIRDEKNSYGQFMRFEMLTWAPIDLDGIDIRWLNPEDIVQLNTYHQMVYEKISPYLDTEEREWLRYYTRPLGEQ